MNKAMVTAITIAGIFISTPIQMSLAMPGAMISVEPSDPNVPQGDVFMINITIDPAGAEVFGAQYVLHFNNTLLNATDQKEGSFLSQDGTTTQVYSNVINNTIGRTRYGGTRMYVDYGVTSPGVLASITFGALEPGICTLNFSNVKLTDPDAQSIPDVLVNKGTCVIDVLEQTPTPTPTTSIPPSGSGNSGNGGLSVTPTATSTPLPSGEDNTTNNNNETSVTPAQAPGPASTTVASPFPTPSSTPPPTMATMPTSKEDTKLPGFGGALAVLGLFAIAYLLSKRKG